MNQKRTPVIDALASFEKRNRAYFNIPGHRGARGVDEGLTELLGKAAFEADRTETDGLDDLHAPSSVIREAQELASDLFGSDHCWFLVNGTTCANEAMILAALNPGEKILVPRNVHKSVLMGMILAGADPVWIMPEREADSGLYGAVSPDAVREALDRNPDVKAVFLVSPTYYGSCSDLAAIADIAHGRCVPLLVDEAHGAHFYFHEALPPGAIAAGADLAAQSTHKTLGSLTQSSMLHLAAASGHPLISKERVEDSLKLVQSTSPSYLLMASLDGTRRLMAESGRELQSRAIFLAEELKQALCGIPGIEVYHLAGAGAGSRPEKRYDPCRVVFSARACGLSGFELQEELFRQRITTELADHKCIATVVTHGNTREEISLMVDAVRSIAVRAARRTLRNDADMKARAEQNAGQNAGQEETVLCIPPRVLKPRDAFFAEKVSVPLEEAAGKTAGELIAPYPPGIPVIYPGEVFTEEICRILETCRRMNISVHGPADPSLNTVRLVKN